MSPPLYVLHLSMWIERAMQNVSRRVFLFPPFANPPTRSWRERACDSHPAVSGDRSDHSSGRGSVEANSRGQAGVPPPKCRSRSRQAWLPRLRPPTVEGTYLRRVRELHLEKLPGARFFKLYRGGCLASERELRARALTALRIDRGGREKKGRRGGEERTTGGRSDSGRESDSRGTARARA